MHRDLYPKQFDAKTAFKVGDDVSFRCESGDFAGVVATITDSHFIIKGAYDGHLRIFHKSRDYRSISHVVVIGGNSVTDFGKEKPAAPSSGHGGGTKDTSFSFGKPSSLGI